MGLDVVDPEAFFHQTSGSFQQLLQLVEGERTRQVPDVYDVRYRFPGWRWGPSGSGWFIWFNERLGLADSSDDFRLRLLKKEIRRHIQYILQDTKSCTVKKNVLFQISCT